MSNVEKVAGILNTEPLLLKIVISLYERSKNVTGFVESCLSLKKFDLDKLDKVYQLLQKKKKRPLQLSFEEEEEPANIKPKATSFKFKKISKSDALKLKRVSVPEPIVPKKEIIDDVLVSNDLSQTTTLIDSPINTDIIDIPEDDSLTDVEDDRAWYGVEEYYNDYNDTDLEEQTTLQVAKHQQEKRRKTQKSRNNDRWVQNQLKNSLGTNHGLTSFESDDEDEDELKFQIVIDKLIPPFLNDEDVELTNKRALISPVKDPKGDLAKLAQNGSNLVKAKRHEFEKLKLDKYKLTDTKIGKVLDIQDLEKEEEEAAEEDGEEEEIVEVNIKDQKKSLPVFSVKDGLVKAILENQVVIIVGETGSGKTTQIPQYLYEAGICKGGMIGVTQPRRVLAMSVAKRVSEEMECKLGDLVGYSIRFEDITNKNTKIKFLTDGILLRECLMDSNLDKYSCIIIDEAHERALNTDIMLGLFKSILPRRLDLKLIITSATINADKFSNFFGNALQFNIPGRTFPVEILSNAYPVTDYVESCVQQVLKIHLQSQSKGDILCFMTGQEDIEICCQVLKERLKEVDHLEKLEILPIFSTLAQDLQAKIFNKSKYRKCIVATNIAETSLTVDGIKFVIDCGLSKLKIFNSKLNMDTLQICPISLAQANQRSGRAGRTGPGVCFRLFTLQQQQDEMYLQPIPEIQRTNLSNTLLLLKNLKISNLINFPFMDPPPLELIKSSLYELWLLKAIDNFGELTQLGKSMSKFPLIPSLSKLLINSIQFNCSFEMIIIVAMLSVPPIFVRSKEQQQESDLARSKFQILESDHLTLLNVFNLFLKNSNKNWCQQNFLNFKNLKRANDIRTQITTIFQNLRIPVKSCGFNNDEVILKCICSTFYLNVAKFHKYAQYINLQNGLTVLLHPTSSLFSLSSSPDYIIYHEILLTSKEYMNYVSVLKLEWILEFGDNCYRLLNSVEGYDDSRHLDFKRNLLADEAKFNEKSKESETKITFKKKAVTKFRSRRGF